MSKTLFRKTLSAPELLGLVRHCFERVRRFIRLICPYPRPSKYKGSGDVDAASSLVCTET